MECCTQYFFVLYANVVLEVFKIYVGIFFWGARKQKWLLLSVQKLMKRTMQRSPVLLLISRGFNPAGLCWAILEADTSSLYIYLRSPGWLSQIPRFFYPVWMVKESFKQTLWGEHLLVAPVAWVEHVTSTGMSSILWLVNCAPLFCPLPLLLHWLAVRENHLHAGGVEGTCRSYQCLSPDISSIMFCSQLYTQAWSPFLPSWAGLGLLPLLWACWKIYCVCWRPDLCGFRLRLGE